MSVWPPAATRSFLSNSLAHLDEQGGWGRIARCRLRSRRSSPRDSISSARQSRLDPRVRCGGGRGLPRRLGVRAVRRGSRGSMPSACFRICFRRDLLLPHKPVLAGEDAFRFRHVLIRDAAYDEVPKATRSELHERHADWLEELGDAVPEPDARIGFHLERAYRLATEVALVDDRARALSARAGQRLAVSALNTFRRGDIRARSAFSSGRSICSGLRSLRPSSSCRGSLTRSSKAVCIAGNRGRRTRDRAGGSARSGSRPLAVRGGTRPASPLP